MRQLLIITSVVLIFLNMNLWGQIVINEFLPDPKDELESEWIELYNYSDQIVYLSGWQLCDLVGCATFDNISIDPLQYIILCQDQFAFETYYPDYVGDLYEIPGWRALNNSGDMILLKDNFSTIIDSLNYEDGNDNNTSWERIASEDSGYDPDNWHSSLESSGSTPGHANSVSVEFSSNANIDLPDRLFSPGCGCEYEYLIINIDMPIDCYLTLSIYSIRGNKLKVIFDNQAMVPGQYQYDGTDGSNQYLDIGMYILLAEFSGSSSGTIKKSFGVAK